MSDTKAKELGITPLARIVSSACHRPEPRDHGPRPGRGVPQALARAGMTIDDIDLVEINEAFAAQVIPRPSTSASTGTSSTSTAAPSPSATRSA
jgi:acetyl-CoA C-acetyltransferase